MGDYKSQSLCQTMMTKVHLRGAGGFLLNRIPQIPSQKTGMIQEEKKMSNLEMRVDALMRLCMAESDQERQKLRGEVRGLMGAKHAPAPDTESMIRQILLELGAPDHLLGHPYVLRAIQLVAEDRMYIRNITFGLYPQLAVEFDTSPARVERAIRHLIEVTWTRGDWEILQRYFGNTVSADKGKPTNGEFVARLANVVRGRLKGEPVQ